MSIWHVQTPIPLTVVSMAMLTSARLSGETSPQEPESLSQMLAAARPDNCWPMMDLTREAKGLPHRSRVTSPTASIRRANPASRDRRNLTGSLSAVKSSDFDRMSIGLICGGGELGTRTPDLVHVRHAL